MKQKQRKESLVLGVDLTLAFAVLNVLYFDYQLIKYSRNLLMVLCYST